MEKGSRELKDSSTNGAHEKEDKINAQNLLNEENIARREFTTCETERLTQYEPLSVCETQVLV